MGTLMNQSVLRDNIGVVSFLGCLDGRQATGFQPLVVCGQEEHQTREILRRNGEFNALAISIGSSPVCTQRQINRDPPSLTSSHVAIFFCEAVEVDSSDANVLQRQLSRHGRCTDRGDLRAPFRCDRPFIDSIPDKTTILG